MPAAEPVAHAPRVAAILVVRDGAEWLPAALASLERLRYPALEVVAVDNGSSDGSAALLRQLLGDDRVVTLRGNAGFGRAVAAALNQVVVAQEADYVLLLHDDLVLAPNALRRMVRALLADDTLAIVGPKLREWKRDRVLQQVGMTIDRLGRAESGLEPDELDQGQHDAQREVLYVSTAGMLLRREVFAQVGGFDARYPAFRDDLDLCWRAWLAGLRVEVVPSAVGYHAGAASRAARPVGTGQRWESRFLAERHSIATLLKNCGTVRIAWVLPVVLLLGVVKTIGFLATRRFGDALATVVAWVWNLFQLPKTLRRRRRVQRRRVRTDAEVAKLFAPGLPRLREYNEALASWLAGGSTRALIDEHDQSIDAFDGPTGFHALARWVRSHAALTVGVLLLVAYVIGAVSLLARGQIVGGGVAAWPESPWAFLSAYAQPWRGEPLPSAAFTSPLQAVLGAVSFAGLGSAWLAQRLAVLGLLPLAWLVAVRAGRLVSPRPGPRVFGATLYVLSPPVLGAAGQGRYGVLVVAALLPGLLLLGVRAADAAVPAASAWRATALLGLGLTVAGAADAALLPVVGLLWLLGLAVSGLAAREGRRTGTLRLAAAGGAAALLLAPWAVSLVLAGWPVGEGADGALPLWRALGVVPPVLSGFAGAGGWIAAATAGAVALGALLVGLRGQPFAVAGLVLVWTLCALAAWGLPQVPDIGIWPPALLVGAALAMAALGVLAAHRAGDALAGHAFGVRHVATGALAVTVLVGVAAGVGRLAADPWEGLGVDPPLVPAFVAAEEPRVGSYRVVLLRAEPDGEVHWDVTEAHGPTMLRFGSVPDPALVAHLEATVGNLVGGVDPLGGAALGLANVRYVVAPSDGVTAELLTALNRQPSIEPVPAGTSRVWRVQTWVPRAAVLPHGRGARLLEVTDPGDLGRFEENGLRAVHDARYAGPNPLSSQGMLLLTNGADPAWRAAGDGRGLERVDTDNPLVNAFVIPEGVTRVAVELGTSRLHALVAAAQLVLVLVLGSLALRPPRAARRRDSGEAPARGGLPTTLEGPGDDTDPALVVPVRAPAGAPLGQAGDSEPSAGSDQGRGPRTPGSDLGASRG